MSPNREFNVLLNTLIKQSSFNKKAALAEAAEAASKIPLLAKLLKGVKYFTVGNLPELGFLAFKRPVLIGKETFSSVPQFLKHLYSPKELANWGAWGVGLNMLGSMNENQKGMHTPFSSHLIKGILDAPFQVTQMNLLGFLNPLNKPLNRLENKLTNIEERLFPSILKPKITNIKRFKRYLMQKILRKEPLTPEEKQKFVNLFHMRRKNAAV